MWSSEIARSGQGFYLMIMNRKRLDIALDLLERLVVGGWYSFFAVRILTSFLATHKLITLLLLISEGAVVAFILFRKRASDVSRRPRDWILAFAGTMLPLSARPAIDAALAPDVVCLALMVTGLVVQISAKLTLRRRFGVVPANRGIEVSGPYRAVRHPMYAGYVLTEIGFFLANASAWNAVIYLLTFALQVARILMEERILSADPEDRECMKRVRYRLIPLVF